MSCIDCSDKFKNLNSIINYFYGKIYFLFHSVHQTQKNEVLSITTQHITFSNISHKLRRCGGLCILLSNSEAIPLLFPDDCPCPCPQSLFPFQEFISFARGLRLTLWFYVSYFVSMNVLFIEVFFPVESSSQRMSTMCFSLSIFHNGISKHSTKLWRIFWFHLGTAPSFLSVVIWAQMETMSKFQASQPLFSCSRLPFFSPEMERNEIIVPIEHPF